MKKVHHGVIPQIAKRPKSFSATFVAIFLITIAFLGVVDALPNPAVATADSAAAQSDATQQAAPTSPEKPLRIMAKSINLSATVNNPDSTDVDVLDQALLTGAARYPTSALLGAEGTVLLFGHSSYLPIVHNQAYKTFDGIQNLKPGDIVSVYSGTREYRYSVTGVKLADATQDVVELPATGKHLVLVTCDSFSKKTSRFVVTADFVGTYSLASN